MAAEASAIVKFDMSKCKILDEAVAMSHIVLYFRKHHFLIKSVDRKISLFKSSGLIDFWLSRFDHARKNKKRVSSEPKVMSFYDLSGIFKVWMFGLALSAFAFGAEVIKKFFENRTTRVLGEIRLGQRC